MKQVLLLFALALLTGCEVIGDIFQAGFVVGIVVVVVVLAIIGWLFGKMRGKG